ncbi:uridine diphosphate glucose pyrophosphatase NUDT14 isoform X4 [Ixodes scapularis]|uniref:uridine diphosphate glucose pyrophosphatase NUDT14 isoform X4 n=1 Tax=Ixodes scapularis TaxID=6945 RepID=UPI001A9FC3B1|nr:uridine diphosphate glucose pyrophosphatase NUDT14 isoform X4 [Ixodes scapularis]
MPAVLLRAISSSINRTFESYLRHLGIYRPLRVKARIMDHIENVRLVECKNSQYVKPTRMLFKQNGHERAWDLMKTHDSVAAVLHNTSRNVLLFVRQFRPAVYYGRIPAEEIAKGGPIDTTKYPGSLGLTLELCAGIVDKSSMSREETMQQEILEECGYNVPLSGIHKVTSFRAGVGVLGARQDLFFAEVTDDMRQTAGGGCDAEGEMINVVELTLPEARKMLTDETIMRPSALLFGVTWFLEMRPKLKA